VSSVGDDHSKPFPDYSFDAGYRSLAIRADMPYKPRKSHFLGHRTQPFAIALIRLLKRKLSGEIVFREPTSGLVPAYAILSHTWGQEEVLFQDMEDGADRKKTVNKRGWRKIKSCVKQSAADGLRYLWADTCCISNGARVTKPCKNVVCCHRKEKILESRTNEDGT
jgi:hypothetical protein